MSSSKSVQAHRHRIKLRIAEIKDVPCMDCEGRFHPACMEFDHVNDDKIQSIARMAGECRPWELIEAEIAKCEIVCANCHRLRTVLRSGAWWYPLA